MEIFVKTIRVCVFPTLGLDLSVDKHRNFYMLDATFDFAKEKDIPMIVFSILI